MKCVTGHKSCISSSRKFNVWFEFLSPWKIPTTIKRINYKSKASLRFQTSLPILVCSSLVSEGLGMLSQ